MWNVVVVDDDAQSVETLRKIVGLSGGRYRVTKVFGDGNEAYKYLRENQFQTDLLITDICTPGLSGLELIRKVRDFGCDISCIIISNYKVFEYAQQAIELNVASYLLKPLEQELFYEILGKLNLQESGE